ncbi:MAG TPA: DUF2071 domain-containing protein, partial [Planctomycetaceae bacterium]|nr:DUF2071 domain-containing protein [Planctomycetaceae bacterium]
MSTPAPLCEIDRLSPSRRPPRSVAGYHHWSDLLFVHWRVPADAVSPLLPPGLTLDTREGEAWVGLVLFEMSGVRPWWSPSVPGISRFLETNVRTYVHREGRDPGVWFFSLEAARWLAVKLARWGWHLPYHFADMQLSWSGRQVEYRSCRRERNSPPGTSHVMAEVGAALDNGGHARPGTLDHFLIERYYLYAHSPRGRLYRGQVHHTSYPLQEARLISCNETLLAASGIA